MVVMSTMTSADGKRTSDLPDCPPRFATPRNLDRLTLGPRVAEVADALGTPLMPWQRQVADVLMELDPKTGLLFYREGVIVVPRQSGKTTLDLAIAVHRARAWGSPQNISYAAQTRNDSRKKWEDDHVAALERSPFGKRRPKPYKVRLSNGNESILWDNGSRHGIQASTESSGHGSTLDLGFVDEAFKHVDGRLEQAFKPAMATRKDAQLIVTSTAGRTAKKSPYLWGKVEAGRARCLTGEHPRVAYFEWSAADDMDRSDPATWWATMPALGRTIDEDTIAADFASMDADEFDRAYLNRWNPGVAGSVIPMDRWLSLATLDAMADPVCFGVDVSPDGEWASIVAAGAADGGIGVEVVDRARGMGWVVPRLVELAASHKPSSVVFTSSGPAIYLASEMATSLGSLVHDTSVAELKAACGGFLSGVMESGLVHRGTSELGQAVEGASRRTVGDSWLWSRRSSTVDISPLVAATLARWGHLTLGAQSKGAPMVMWS